jgi:predicted unusual protein kinase regulating ubiquinone biosynthesis (AarF/ABC1/UbiB family)
LFIAGSLTIKCPGIAETIAADLRNVALLRRMLRITAPAQDVDALLTELPDRIGEELDYRREAGNQRLMAAYYDGHPTIHVPGIVSELSTRRMVTSELSGGARFAELASWPQHERDLAAETCRFAPAGSIFLNRSSLLCVLVVERATTSPRGTRPEGDGRRH